MKPEPVPPTLSTPDFPNALTCGGSLKTCSDLRVQESRLVEWGMKAQEEQEEVTYHHGCCDPDIPAHRACPGFVLVDQTDGSGWTKEPCDCECHR